MAKAEIWIGQFTKNQQRVCVGCPFRKDSYGTPYCNPAVLERNWDRPPTAEEIIKTLGPGNVPKECPNGYSTTDQTQENIPTSSATHKDPPTP